MSLALATRLFEQAMHAARSGHDDARAVAEKWLISSHC
jgi:hypothetical protein